MAFIHSPKIVIDNMVLYLDTANRRSYPRSGTVWYDLTGNKYNGTLVGGPTFSDTNGGSLVFNGTNNIDLPSLGTFSRTSTLSIETWVYPTSNPSTQRSIVTQYSNSNIFDCGISSDSNRYFYAYVSRGNQAADIVYDTTPYSINNWYSITGIYDGSFVSLYVNGIYKARTAYSAALTSVVGNQVWYIGKLRQVSTNYYYWNGNISNTRIYNRTLSPQEILQNFNATRSRYGV